MVLCDFVGNGCFYLLFQVSAWPNVKTRKNTYKVHKTTVKSRKHEVKNTLNQTKIKCKSVANQCKSRSRVSMFFGTLICTDLQLICTPQITANQSLPTFKKHYKTCANHCKSLQITPPKNHRKNNAELQTLGACTWRRLWCPPPSPVAKATKHPPGLASSVNCNSSCAVNKLTSALSVTWFSMGPESAKSYLCCSRTCFRTVR